MLCFIVYNEQIMQKTNIETSALVELQYVTFNEDTVSRMRNPLLVQ